MKEIERNNIKELYIAKDKDLIKASEVGNYIEKLNESFSGKAVKVQFYQSSVRPKAFYTNMIGGN